MSSIHDYRVTYMANLAAILFARMQDDFYKNILLDDTRKPENILETILFGTSHIRNRMLNILPDNIYVKAVLLDHLKQYCNQYATQHKLPIEDPFNFFFDIRLSDFKKTLGRFVYHNPGPILPSTEAFIFYERPLSEFDEATHDGSVMLAIQLVARLRSYVEMIDILIDPLVPNLKEDYIEVSQSDPEQEIVSTIVI